MSQIDSLLDTAFDLFNQKDFDYAEELARNVLRLSPTNGDALYLLGLIASRVSAYEPAEKLLYQAVQLYPDNKQYKTSLGFVLEKQGRLDEALSFYEEFKDDAFVLAQIGFIYLQKGLYDFANSAFDKALELNSSVLTAYIGKALFVRHQNLHEKSLEFLLLAKDKGESGELFYQLSVSYRLLGRYQEAHEAILKALTFDEVASFYNEKGLIEEALLLDDEAIFSYEKALKLNSYFADSYANLGNIYLRQNKLRKAEDSYKRAIGIDDKFVNAHHNLALLLYKEDRLNESLEHFRSVILIEPKNISALYNLAIVLEDLGDYSEAAGLYFNVLVSDNRFPDIHFRIANVLTMLTKKGRKEKKQALDFANGWIKNFPDNVICQYTYAALNGDKISKELAQKYSEILYDAFAKSYDETMKKLQSKTLDEVVSLLPNDKFEKVLDLACGTGTLALKLEHKPCHLTGVDISNNMLLLAQEKNMYDELIHDDILSFFETNEDTYSLIVASDVMGYFDDISSFLKEVYSHLTKDGCFVFSIEETNESDVFLAPIGRYLYHPEFVKKELIKSGFSVLEEKHIDLRNEGAEKAKGVIFKCQK